ncbi:MAG: hypothetical protein J0L61_04260 [Planctomycetes bacterium]|nr:hypothetical protein [Planctomycetota bacterium]
MMTRAVLLACGVVMAAGSAVAVPPTPAPSISTGPDVVASGIGSSSGSSPFGDSTTGGVTTNGSVGSVVAYSVGTISCNIGTADAIWTSGTNAHPLIGTQIYRYRIVNGAGQFDQIGLNWLKHSFCAADAANCSQLTNPAGALGGGSGCQWLGRFATDTYGAGLNGSQSSLGPRSEVNPWTGAYPYPYVLGAGATGDAIYKRTQVKTADLIAGANYVVEVVYICTDEPAANRYNNYSYRIGTSSGTTISMTGSTEALRPAIVGWKEKYDNQVTLVNIDPSGLSDGRLILGYRVTQTGPTTWHYEYNVFNMNNHNSVRSFSVPVSGGVSMSNVDFNDVDYHSGEPYSGTDWPLTTGGGAATWATQTFAQNSNANAIRWSTMYSFRFDANAAPRTGTATLGMFRSGSSVTVENVLVPTVPTPERFSLVSPQNGATAPGLTPTLTWSESGNAESYTVTVANDPGLTDPVAGGSVAALSFPVPNGSLVAGRTYYWNVTALNQGGSKAAFGGPWSFLTPPPACVGDLNNDGATNTGDLAVFLGAFGTAVTPGTSGDLDGDGNVNTADLALILGAFGCGA